MLKVLGKLPRDLIVAVSGGPDSMAILDFLSNNHNVTAAYFDHGTPFGTKCKSFLKEFWDFIVERKKYGRRKARRRFQFSKR